MRKDSYDWMNKKRTKGEKGLDDADMASILTEVEPLVEEQGRDVSRTERLERELQQSREALERAQGENKTLSQQNARLLEESEARNINFAERAADGIVILQEGVIQFINPKLADMGGYDPDDLRGSSFVELVTPESRELVWESYMKRLKGEQVPSIYEVQGLAKDGSTFPVELNAGVVEYKGKPADMIILRDLRERKKAENTLRESQERYSLIVEKGNDGIVIVKEGPRFVFANQRILEMTGYTLEEVNALPLEKIIAPGSPNAPEVALERMQRRLAGENVVPTYPVDLLRKDGGTLPCEISNARVEYEGEPADLILIRDISDRRAAEEMLRDSEERFRSLFENAYDAIAIVSADGTIAFESPSVERVLGYKPEDLIGKSGFAMLHPDDLPRIADKFGPFIGTAGATESMEVQCMRKDGSWRWMDLVGQNLLDNPKVQGIVVNYRDITERKQAEEAIQEADSRYRAIYGNPLQGVFVNDLQGRFLEANEYGLELMGYTAEEVKKIAYQDIIHPEDLPRAFESLAQVATGGSMPPLEIRVFAKSGEVIWISTLVIPLKRDGEIYAVLGFAHDITERKQTEEELQRSEERLKDLVEKLRLSQEDLSTPVVQVWDRVLALPLIGVIDNLRAQKIMEVLLHRIVDVQAETVILDVTGVANMDTEVTNYLLKTVQSASLLGTQCVITGITPEVAQAITHLEMEMSNIVTKRDMQEGLRWALRGRGHEFSGRHVS